MNNCIICGSEQITCGTNYKGKEFYSCEACYQKAAIMEKIIELRATRFTFEKIEKDPYSVFPKVEATFYTIQNEEE